MTGTTSMPLVSGLKLDPSLITAVLYSVRPVASALVSLINLYQLGKIEGLVTRP